MDYILPIGFVMRNEGLEFVPKNGKVVSQLHDVGSTQHGLHNL